MQPRDPKTPDEIRAMPSGELLDYVKRPSRPTEDAHIPSARRCEQHGVYLWPEGVECPVCVHAERDALRGGLAVAKARIQVLEMQAPGYAELERERIIAHLGTAFLTFVAHDPEQHLVMVGTDNIRQAIESIP